MSPKTRGFSKSKHSRGKSFKNNKKRKFNINKNHSFNSKRKLKQDDDSFNDEKRPKFELPYETKDSSSSESEEEDENPLKQLLNTFEIPVSIKKITSVDTDNSESSDQDDANDDVNGSINEDLSESEQLSDDGETNNDNEIEINKDNSENDSDLEEDDEIDEDSLKSDLPSKDPFMQHLNYDLHEKLIDSLKNTNSKLTEHIEWPWIGKMLYSIPTCESYETEKSNFTLEENKQYAPLGKIPTKIIQDKMDLNEVHIKSQIHKNIKPANKELSEDDVSPLTEFQCELFSIINNYQDLYFSERTFENAEEIRFVYSLHAINHILKTRTKILHHNARLQKKNDVPEEFRDQGLVRPKVLIIVPFRDSALKIVQMLMDILVPAEAGQVINKLRFMEDFSGNELILPKKNPKPEDYELTFTGNCDDTFKIGIQVTKKSLKLYADFYSSDIIIASPLGLRLTVGAEGEAERDHDFLASIELLIMDQTELFLMQNWDHLIHVLDHLHKQPKQSHGTDFSRIRTWTLNGWSRYYRQTLIFSSLQLPEINAIFNRKCNNYAGSVRTVNPIRNGSIINVHVQVPQVYKRFKIDDVLKSIDARFDFFINKILPQFRDTIMKQCLIYVPCYFDYVKIRNHFKREDISFVQICEYSENAKIARARDMFFHGDAHFMLYSERFHYFRRIRVKGIRHIIFYQPPIFPHFYSEMCNFMQEAFQNKKCGSASNMTVTVIYSKYDYQRLAPILGSERLAKMATSENNFHMFTSTDR